MFKSEDERQAEIVEASNRKIIESHGGSTTQNLFETKEQYRARIAREAAEIINENKSSCGPKAPSGSGQGCGGSTFILSICLVISLIYPSAYLIFFGLGAIAIIILWNTESKNGATVGQNVLINLMFGLPLIIIWIILKVFEYVR